MPTYSFINTESGEEFDMFMSYSARETFLSENKNVQSCVTAAAIVSGVSTSTQHRVPDGFKEVLSKVAEAHPTSDVANRHGKKSIKQVRTEQIVKKHVQKITGVKL